ncbi:MAG: lamin tail domain-containing protein [Patescibacteria group bacterium]|nr:lamin tail domain-containing protein [Patescibacteria group bacterium]
MKKSIKLLFWSFAIAIIAIFNTNAYFVDQAKVVSNVFATGTWPTGGVVINEVYYDVDGNHGAEGGAQNDEWIELYNNSASAVNLKNWSITDNNNTVVINSDSSIPAYGFALLSKSANTWGYWGINPGNPGIGIEIVVMGQFNQFSNSGDRVILKDALGNVVDQMSYGTDNSIFLPACADVAEGHSLERSPKGHDTGLSIDFINQANPTPGSGL